MFPNDYAPFSEEKEEEQTSPFSLQEISCTLSDRQGDRNFILFLCQGFNC